MRKCIVFIGILFPLLLNAQNFVIKGNGEFYAGEKITISRYIDYYTKRTELIGEYAIDSTGKFTIEIPTTSPQLVVFKLELREIHIHTHPNVIAKMNLLPIKMADNQRIPLQYTLRYEKIPTEIAPDSLYTMIQDSFGVVQNNIDKEKGLKPVYDAFFDYVQEEYATFIKNDILFASFYTNFSGRSYLAVSAKNGKLISDNFNQNPVLYTDPEYIQYFKAVTHPYLNDLFVKHPKELQSALSQYEVYGALKDLMAADANLTQGEINDLALLTYLNSKSSNHLFTGSQKMAIWKQMSEQSEIKLHRDIAKFLLLKENPLAAGEKAPDFMLKDFYGMEHLLSDWEGKPIYLAFIHTHSVTAHNQLKVIEKLRTKYKKIQYLIVVIDRDTSKLGPLIEEASNLDILYLARDYSVLEKYAVWNFPLYFFIDKKGYFIESPANTPDQMFPAFEKMFPSRRRDRWY